MTIQKTPIHTDAAPAAIGPYSQAVRVGNLLFTSGQIPLKPDGTLLEGDIRAQTEQVLANLSAVLQAGGSRLDHVVKCTCFLKDMNDFSAMNEVYGRFFGAAPPARSAVEVARLPRDVRIEIEAVALIPHQGGLESSRERHD
jgi:2-iminobutanoate/2-iminopropanoate deaminase